MDVFLLESLTGAQAQLTPDDARHCVRVRRHRVGDLIGAVDGQGLFVEGPITLAERDRVLFEITHSESDWGEPSRPTTLLLSPPGERDRLEWLVEKAVELGLTRLVITQTQRSEPGTPNLERLTRLMLAALKQSHRSRVPELLGPVPWGETLAQASGLKLIGAIGSPLTLLAQHARLVEAQAVTWAIGPPGDYTPAELELAYAHGFAGVSLGQTRLRSETAALYALAVSKLTVG